jgi:NADH-quinone oxidoreductase subunit C
VIRLSSTETVEAPPTDDRREALLARFTTELGDAVVGSFIRPGDDLWIRVTREAWPTVAEVARQRLNCAFFDFLSAIDWLPSPFGREMDAEVDNPAPREPGPMATGYAGGDTRFQVFARVVNIRDHWGVTLKADLPDDDLTVGTWSRTYLGANWHERETHEMFGIGFLGHPWLQNLYLPSGFEGFPLRKDFPLLSRRVKPWPGIVDVEPMPGEDAADEPTGPEGPAGAAAESGRTEGGDA